MAVDIHNLGSFATVGDVYKRYPDGGSVGDYFTLEGDVAKKYYWDPVYRTWGVEDAPAPPTPEIEAGAILNMDALYSREEGYFQIDDEDAPNYAPSVVPANLRVKSLILTFLEGINRPAAYQFFGASTTDFEDKDCWKKMAYFADIHSISLISEMMQVSSATWNASSDGTATTLAAATDACPADVRKMGLNIILKNSSGKWEAWQFIGTNILAQFEDTAYWQRIDTAQHDFINLTEKVPPTEGYYMLFSGSPGQIAVNHVPDDYRYPGVVITFFSGAVWELWQFIGTDAAEQWANPSYWLEIGNYILTKAAIEALLTGSITSHSHPSMGQVCKLIYIGAEAPADPLSGDMYYNTATGFIYTRGDEAWSDGETPGQNILYYSLADSSGSIVKFWRYTESSVMTQLNIYPASSFDTALRTTATSFTFNGTQALFPVSPTANKNQYMVVPATFNDDPITLVEAALVLESIITGLFVMDLYVFVESGDAPVFELTLQSPVSGRYMYFKPGYSLPATLAKGLHHFTFVRDMSELVNVNLYVEHTYTAAS